MPPLRFGGFVLVRPLGEGGMGQVHLAVHGTRTRPRLCVLKRPLPELLTGDKNVTRFVREAELSTRLVHPGIVRSFEHGHVDGVPFYAQEYVQGHDLSVVLAKAGNAREHVPWRTAVAIARQLADALAYAHESHGVIHRDVSPQNVRLELGGRTRLLDFGTAKAQAALQLTTPGTRLGKLAYMSPEQRRGEPVDATADVFSLGVVLWQILTGRSPLDLTPAGTPTDELPSPCLFNSAVPPSLEAIVAKATATAPARRFASAAELRDALARLGSDDEHSESGAVRDLLRRYVPPSAPPALDESPFAEAVALLPEDEPPAPTKPRVNRRWMSAAVSIFCGALAIWGLRSRFSSQPQAQPLPLTPAAPVREANVEAPPAPFVPAAPVTEPTPAPQRATPRKPPPPKPQLLAPNGAESLSQAREAFQHGAFERAAQLAAAAALAGVDEAWALVGAAAFRAGHYAQAEEAYRRALEVTPASADLEKKLAIARKRRQEKQGATQPQVEAPAAP